MYAVIRMRDETSQSLSAVATRIDRSLSVSENSMPRSAGKTLFGHRHSPEKPIGLMPTDPTGCTEKPPVKCPVRRFTVQSSGSDVDAGPASKSNVTALGADRKNAVSHRSEAAGKACVASRL